MIEKARKRMAAATRRAIALTALHIALDYAEAGVHEEGGNNRGDQVEFFQHLMGGSPGDSWCADFVATCLVKADARVNGSPEDRPNLLLDVGPTGKALMPLSGYCPSIWHNAVHADFWEGPGFSPSPGDLVLFDFEGQGEPHHIGFVSVVETDGSLKTVEGNTSAPAHGSRSDGDGVYVKARSTQSVFGYVHWE
jgi:hypothetical protein